MYPSCSKRVHDLTHRRDKVSPGLLVLVGVVAEDLVSDKDESDSCLWVVRKDVGVDPIVCGGLVGAYCNYLVVRDHDCDVKIGLREER